MKDFLRIFLILVCISIAFFYGKNYGQKFAQNINANQKGENLKNDELSLQANQILSSLRTKLQNIILNSKGKKAEEVLVQMGQVFDQDLGIKNIINELENKMENKTQIKSTSEHPVEQTVKEYDYKKIKSYEWILQNSNDLKQTKAFLKNLQIYNMDRFLQKSKKLTNETLERYLGEYRGPILDIDNQVYGAMVFKFKVENIQINHEYSGQIVIFKNGQEILNKSMLDENRGFELQASDAIIIQNENTYFQIYKVTSSGSLIGNYYERMVNGTTKIIGSFVLNRVDQF